MFMDSNNDISSGDSEVTMYIASEDEILQQPGGAAMLSGASILASMARS
jgi:hypothetical protein